MLFYRFVQFVSMVIGWFFFSLRSFGKRNLPAKGAFILASNHISYLDPFVIPIDCPRRLSFLARDTLFDHKLLGWFLKNIGCFPIKRKSADIGAIKEILNRLKKGRPVLIFPEGTRHVGQREKMAEAGIGMIALKSGVPVIPIRVVGSDLVLPPGSKRIKKGPIKIIYGEPVEFSKSDSYQEIADKIIGTIYSLST